MPKSRRLQPLPDISDVTPYPPVDWNDMTVDTADWNESIHRCFLSAPEKRL